MDMFQVQCTTEGQRPNQCPALRTCFKCIAGLNDSALTHSLHYKRVLTAMHDWTAAPWPVPRTTTRVVLQEEETTEDTRIVRDARQEVRSTDGHKVMQEEEDNEKVMSTDCQVLIGKEKRINEKFWVLGSKHHLITRWYQKKNAARKKIK